jgi:NhaA family Na+:H+ antiporter
MSVFIANLAFQIESHLAAAKAGVLLASVTAAIVGLAFGRLRARRLRTAAERDGPIEISQLHEQHRR